jgi:hypothetical protein
MGDPEGPELLRELGSELGLDLAAGRDAAARERLARRYEAKAEGFERWEPRCVAEAVAAGIRHMMRVDEEI